MMKRALLLCLLLLACPAQALKLVVWDNEMQTKVGAGESSGNRFNVQFVKDYSGPVKVIFSQSADERAKGLFPGLQSSYDGLLRNGQLTLDTEPAAKGRSSAAVQNAPLGGALLPSNQTLSRFLQQYKLNVVGTPNSQLVDPTFGLPDFKLSGK